MHSPVKEEVCFCVLCKKQRSAVSMVTGRCWNHTSKIDLSTDTPSVTVLHCVICSENGPEHKLDWNTVLILSHTVKKMGVFTSIFLKIFSVLYVTKLLICNLRSCLWIIFFSELTTEIPQKYFSFIDWSHLSECHIGNVRQQRKG